MVLQKLIVAISLFCSAAHASGEFGIAPGQDLDGNKNYKFFFNVYEHLGNNYYLNPYYQYDKDVNLTQHFTKLDLNKHLTDKVILGVGVSNINNNFFNRVDFRANLVIKLW